MGDARNQGEESGEGCDGPYHHLPRRSCPHRHRQALEGHRNDIQVEWVRMAQSVLRYNVVIVGKYFNKGSWVSEAWKKEHPEETEGEPESLPERIPNAEERMGRLNIEYEPESSVCVVFGHATSTRRSVDVCWNGSPEPTERADQSTNTTERFLSITLVDLSAFYASWEIRLTSTGRGNPNTEDERTNQPI